MASLSTLADFVMRIEPGSQITSSFVEDASGKSGCRQGFIHSCNRSLTLLRRHISGCHPRDMFLQTRETSTDEYRYELQQKKTPKERDDDCESAHECQQLPQNEPRLHSTSDTK
jgi:hypothetical protein